MTDSQTPYDFSYLRIKCSPSNTRNLKGRVQIECQGAEFSSELIKPDEKVAIEICYDQLGSKIDDHAESINFGNDPYWRKKF